MNASGTSAGTAKTPQVAEGFSPQARPGGGRPGAVRGELLLALAARVAHGEIKALSIKQPYPHHIFHDGKDVENRDWPTKGRGWFIVHAGKTTDGALPKALAEAPRGGIVGMARIVDCVEQMDSRWFFGRYGFVLRDAFPVPLIPCRGQLGFFAPPQDAIEQLASALRARHQSAAGEGEERG